MKITSSEAKIEPGDNRPAGQYSLFKLSSLLFFSFPPFSIILVFFSPLIIISQGFTRFRRVVLMSILTILRRKKKPCHVMSYHVSEDKRAGSLIYHLEGRFVYTGISTSCPVVGYITMITTLSFPPVRSAFVLDCRLDQDGECVQLRARRPATSIGIL